MDLQKRNNVKVSGRGGATLIFLHGFGCDQSMWNYILPHFSERFRVILLDHVGAGGSDLGAYCGEKYSSLDGYAQDLNEIIEEFAIGPVILVGHSVSAMICALADGARLGRIAAHVMIGLHLVTSTPTDIPGGSRKPISIPYSIPWTVTISDGRAPWHL